MSEYKIGLLYENERKTVYAGEGKNLLELLIEEKIFLQSPCAGHGRCGKCKVRFSDNAPIPTEDEKTILSENELLSGIRLACRININRACSLEIPETPGEKFDILDEFPQKYDSSGVVIDIGTTTVAMNYFKKGKKTKKYLCVNSQRKYGADVISRIEFSNNGGKDILKELIINDIKNGLRELDPDKNERIIISGNTAMIHFLMGWSCEELGVFPFRPFYSGSVKTTAYELFGEDAGDVFIFPCISAFLGGDLLSGLYFADFLKKDKISLLIDLGTNGEFALGNRERILASSSSAGPAFEGGSLKCGMGSVPGAVYDVDLIGRKPFCKTIGGIPAEGLCGTGAISLLAELLYNGFADSTGALSSEYFDDGFIFFKKLTGEALALTSKDIRELQLAKAAVRAGIETLIKEYGASYDDIENVFLCGGFGYNINVKKAVRIGLIPKELEDKIKISGNSALAGMCRFLSDECGEENLMRLASKVKPISLESNSEFRDMYISNLSFSK